MIDQQHWNEFYKHFDETHPSDFAQWATDMIKGYMIFDFGCGNGRDTEYLAQIHPNVIGVDTCAPDGDKYARMDILDYITNNQCPEDSTVYCRWLFHAIPMSLENKILGWTNGQIMIEARAVGDDSFDEDHYRRLIEPRDLLSKLHEFGYITDYVRVGYGMSQRASDDPYIVRVVAHRWKT